MAEPPARPTFCATCGVTVFARHVATKTALSFEPGHSRRLEKMIARQQQSMELLQSDYVLLENPRSVRLSNNRVR